MSISLTLHRFLAEMSYGCDGGVTQIWLTPSLFRKLVAEARGVMKPDEWDLSDNWGWPSFIEFEGRRIFCSNDRSRVE